MDGLFNSYNRLLSLYTPPQTTTFLTTTAKHFLTPATNKCTKSQVYTNKCTKSQILSQQSILYSANSPITGLTNYSSIAWPLRHMPPVFTRTNHSPNRNIVQLIAHKDAHTSLVIYHNHLINAECRQLWSFQPTHLLRRRIIGCVVNQGGEFGLASRVPGRIQCPQTYPARTVAKSISLARRQQTDVRPIGA